MTRSATQRRERVLIKPADETAKLLRANPGKWFLIGVGYPDEQHTLSQVSRIYAQTAYRIRQNYRPDARGILRGLSDFAADEWGSFEARSTADQSRANQLAPVELSARYVPHNVP